MSGVAIPTTRDVLFLFLTVLLRILHSTASPQSHLPASSPQVLNANHTALLVVLASEPKGGEGAQLANQSYVGVSWLFAVFKLVSLVWSSWRSRENLGLEGRSFTDPTHGPGAGPEPPPQDPVPRPEPTERTGGTWAAPAPPRNMVTEVGLFETKKVFQ
jgi:hypothetical protein